MAKDNGKKKMGNPLWFKGMPSNNPSGRPSKKIFSDALRLALNREAQDDEGNTTTNLCIIAAKIVAMAKDGNMNAISEIANRMEGRPIPINERDDTDAHRDDHGMTEEEIKNANAQFLANLLAEVAATKKPKNKSKMN